MAKVDLKQCDQGALGFLTRRFKQEGLTCRASKPGLGEHPKPCLIGNKSMGARLERTGTHRQVVAQRITFQHGKQLAPMDSWWTVGDTSYSIMRNGPECEAGLYI
eukprot:scaffold83792_cov13-Tisochrysis_lutea.AAC.1